MQHANAARVSLMVSAAFTLPSGIVYAQATSAPAVRQMRYTSRPREQAVAWQRQVRNELFDILKLNDLRRMNIPLNPRELSSETKGRYILREMEISSAPGRRIKVLVTLPVGPNQRPQPAVVCIHGHGGNRRVVYDPRTIYKGFAAALAAEGFVTIAADVGQHEVYEKGHTLMGERLWDLMRCVEYLLTLPQVDESRIGCAGLSLGGEMAMWLGAMDDRIGATVSAGFLTLMDQMERNHCMCWKFPGLRERVDYADVYSLVAPRALQCQNGRKEPPTQFTPELAAKAMKEIQVIYTDFGKPDNAELDIHDGAHEIDLPALMAFFRNRLGVSASQPAD